MTAPKTIPAGTFSTWLVQIQDALQGKAESNVPCGTCTACCASSQFVHIGPDEKAALAHIPRALLFPAPGLPRGHMLMGHDTQGRCPMLKDNRCSIYEHRPRTCRTYDCRVFPAAGLVPEDDGKALIARQVKRWRFEHPTSDDQTLHDAVKAAAAYVREHSSGLPADAVPVTPTQQAVAAVQLHPLFVRRERDGALSARTPSSAEVNTGLVRIRKAPR